MKPMGLEDVLPHVMHGFVLVLGIWLLGFDIRITCVTT
jgi:hypothetical protein